MAPSEQRQWSHLQGSRKPGDSLLAVGDGAACFELRPIGDVEPVGIMAMHYLSLVLQLSVALGILNVWLLRPNRATPFRGGDAKTLREEFAAYGLPFWFMGVVGVFKVGLALVLLAGLWLHTWVQPAAIGLGLLMVGAFVVHLKVRDPIRKALPALGVLAMCASIALLSPTG